MTWIDTMRDQLIADEGYDEPEHLPGDKSQERRGMILLLADIVIVLFILGAVVRCAVP